MAEKPKATEGRDTGRPSKYKPEYCEAVEAWGKEGLSITEMAAELNVTRQTLYIWADQHPEFFDAFTRAKEFSLSWWERQARIGLYNKDGVSLNASLWSRSMAARFPADYTERKDFVSSDGSMSPKDGSSVLDRINSRLDRLIANGSAGDNSSGPE